MDDPKPLLPTPSDLRPRNVSEIFPCKGLAPLVEKATQELAKLMEKDGPHWIGLCEFLTSYVGTPHEHSVWGKYHDFFGVPESSLKLIERQAAEEGLTGVELRARETLKELKYFVKSRGIPEFSDDPSKPRIDNTPTSMWDDDKRVTSTQMVNAAGLEGKAKSNFLSQLDYWRKGRKAKPSETGKPIQRQKLADDSDYSEYADRKPNEAKYDYRFGAVKHLLGPFLIDRK